MTPARVVTLLALCSGLCACASALADQGSAPGGISWSGVGQVLQIGATILVGMVLGRYNSTLAQQREAKAKAERGEEQTRELLGKLLSRVDVMASTLADLAEANDKRDARLEHLTTALQDQRLACATRHGPTPPPRATR